jgi:hypothetical protein
MGSLTWGNKVNLEEEQHQQRKLNLGIDIGGNNNNSIRER